MILMSNNQWKCDLNSPDWQAAGEDCSSDARVEGIVRAYREIMPDILALQEVSAHMADLMMHRLNKNSEGAEYEYISGGDTPLVYRHDKFMLAESGFLRYPNEIPGIEGNFNNHETKSYCFGVFECRETHRIIAVMSTHLWWKSSRPEAKNYQPRSNEARAYQIALALSKMDEIIKKYSCPGVVMGDLNASVNSLCLERARELGYTEAHDMASGERDEGCGFHECGPHAHAPYEKGSFERAIDHILIKDNRQLSVKSFSRLTPDWFETVSDHYPLYIDADFVK